MAAGRMARCDVRRCDCEERYEIRSSSDRRGKRAKRREKREENGFISGPRAEGREQRKEKRQGRRKKLSPAGFPAFLQGPVATSMKAQKPTTSFRRSLPQKF